MIWSLFVSSALATGVSAFGQYGYWDAGDESVVEEARWYVYNSGSTASPSVWGGATTGWDLYFDGLAGYESTGVFLVSDNWWGWSHRCGVEDYGTDGSSLWIEPSCLTGEAGFAAVLFMSYDTWAEPGRSLAYALASDATATAAYTPSNRFNSTGGAVRVIHRGPGRYTVRFEGITDAGGVPLVTPYTAGDTDFCRIGGWRVVGGGVTVDVSCLTGLVATDMPFSIAYTAGGVLTGADSAGESDGGFYAWVDMTSGTGPETPAISWSPAGWTAVEVDRYGPGEYGISTFGPASLAGMAFSVQVSTGVGSAVCESTTFPMSYAGDVAAAVRCEDSRGRLVDTPFAVVASVGGA